MVAADGIYQKQIAGVAPCEGHFQHDDNIRNREKWDEASGEYQRAVQDRRTARIGAVGHVSRLRPRDLRRAYQQVSVISQQPCAVSDDIAPYGASRLVPALCKAVDDLCAHLVSEFNYNEVNMQMLKAVAHTATSEHAQSTCDEWGILLPNPEDIMAVLERATDGLAATIQVASLFRAWRAGRVSYRFFLFFSSTYVLFCLPRVTFCVWGGVLFLGLFLFLGGFCFIGCVCVCFYWLCFPLGVFCLLGGFVLPGVSFYWWLCLAGCFCLFCCWL